VDKESLLKNIMMLDFMAVDLELFLNTHPEDSEALEMYNNVIANGDKCRCYYENVFGPLCSFRSEGKNGWLWPEEIWPWQKAQSC
jgi:spore coat protein JB